MASLRGNQVTTLLGLGADAMDNMFDVSITPPEGLTTLYNRVAGREGLIPFNDPTMLSNLTIRAEGFQPPKYKIKTYKVGYKGVEVDRPQTKLDMERQFELTFRLDSNYQVYRFLSAWRSLTVQASSGYVTNALWSDSNTTTQVSDINKVYGTVYVAALARPVFMVDGDPFRAKGVTSGKFEPYGDSSSGGEPTGTVPSEEDLNRWEFNHVWLAELDEPQYKTEGGDIIKIKATFKFGDFTDPAYAAYGNATS
jgi:hypothetical protein